MHLKDFKYFLLIISFLLFSSYFTLAIFSIGYEESTNTTELAAISYKIMSFIVFSLKYLLKLLPNFISFILSIITSASIVSLVFMLIKLIIIKAKFIFYKK